MASSTGLERQNKFRQILPSGALNNSCGLDPLLQDIETARASQEASGRSYNGPTVLLPYKRTRVHYSEMPLRLQ